MLILKFLHYNAVTEMIEAIVSAMIGMFGTYTILDIVSKAKSRKYKQVHQ